MRALISKCPIKSSVIGRNLRVLLEKYSGEMYGLYRPTSDKKQTLEALTAFLDLLFEERGFEPLGNAQQDKKRIESEWFNYLMPKVNSVKIKQLLDESRFVVIQGPPGTGKTRMALELIENEYKAHGRTIQLHPNATYENFIGGLAPEQSNDALGLRFRPTSGFLMQAAAAAQKVHPMPYLLHIDEINRADLSKVLGEAIYLLEPKDRSLAKLHWPTTSENHFILHFLFHLTCTCSAQ